LNLHLNLNSPPPSSASPAPFDRTKSYQIVPNRTKSYQIAANRTYGYPRPTSQQSQIKPVGIFPDPSPPSLWRHTWHGRRATQNIRPNGNGLSRLGLRKLPTRTLTLERQKPCQPNSAFPSRESSLSGRTASHPKCQGCSCRSSTRSPFHRDSQCAYPVPQGLQPREPAYSGSWLQLPWPD